MRQSKRQFTSVVSNCASRAKDGRGMKYLSRRIWATGTRKRMCAQSTKEKEVEELFGGQKGGKGCSVFARWVLGRRRRSAAESFLSAGKRFFNRRD
jgi:hypothetical protein